MHPLDAQAALNRSSWFLGRPEELRSWIVAHARPKSLREGEALYLRGDLMTGMHLLVSGTIRVSTSTIDGRERLLAVVAGPTWLGEIGLFDDEPHEHDAWAESEVRLLHLGRQDLMAFLDDRPVHWRSFGILLAQRLRLAFHGITDGALSPPATRLARRLLAMAGRYGDRPIDGEQRIEVQQDQLGSMLSLSRQTVNKLLKDLEAEGTLRLTRGAIDILRVERLRVLARAEDAMPG